MRLLAAVALLLLWPATAAAHVTVVPASARPGQTVPLTFEVPDERDDARTVRIDVVIPAGLKPEVASHAGWTQTLVGDTVSWTADGTAAIRPGRTERFTLTLGPLPKTGRLVFKALQHYSDGAVVRWIQDPVADAERPAAVLELGTRPTAPGRSGASPPPWIALAGALVLGMGGAVLWRRRLT
jgi:LPXTG-motif cell wall-anchored protein